jgi:hypothetical protein
MMSLKNVCTEMQSFFPTRTNTMYKIDNYSSSEILFRKTKLLSRTERIELLKEGQAFCGHIIRLHAHPLPVQSYCVSPAH